MGRTHTCACTLTYTHTHCLLIHISGSASPRNTPNMEQKRAGHTALLGPAQKLGMRDQAGRALQPDTHWAVIATAQAVPTLPVKGSGKPASFDLGCK